MKKMTGSEYKKMMEADWDAFLNVTGAYVDAQEVTINGMEENEFQGEVPDDAIVRVYSGAIMADQDIDLSFQLFVTRWLNAQNTQRFVVSIQKQKHEQWEALLRENTWIKVK
jgi:hypothetical protein